MPFKVKALVCAMTAKTNEFQIAKDDADVFESNSMADVERNSGVETEKRARKMTEKGISLRNENLFKVHSNK